MPAALPLAALISQSSSASTEFRVIKAQYGNGYSQRAPDGINNSVGSWDLAWDNITAAEFGVITAAFEQARGADYFTWLAPGDLVTKRWIVAKYTKAAMSGDIYSVSANLQQVFDI